MVFTRSNTYQSYTYVNLKFECFYSNEHHLYVGATYRGTSRPTLKLQLTYSSIKVKKLHWQYWQHNINIHMSIYVIKPHLCKKIIGYK